MGFIDSLNSVNDPIIDENNQNQNNNAHLEKLIEEIFKTDNIAIRSDLTKEQVLVFAKAELYADTFNVDIIKRLLTNYMTLSLSKNRSSRKELVEIAKNMKQVEPDTSPIEKLLG